MGYKLAVAVLILGAATPPATAEQVAFAETPLAATSEIIPVGLLGDPAQLRFEGVTAFPEEQLRNALAGDLEYQAAARPSADLSEFVRVLSLRVSEGYRKAGIYVKVDVKIDGTPVVVVKESKQQRFGHFRVADDSNLPPGLLERVQGATRRAWTYHFYGMTPASDTDRSTWTEGKLAQLDLGSFRAICTHLSACYADFGLMAPRAPFESERLTDAEMMNAILTEKGVTAGLTLSTIDLYGLTRHTREEVLDFLRVAESAPLHHQTLEQVCDRLESCHRFWRQDVHVYLPKPPGRYEEQGTGARLVIRLVEYDKVPKLGDPLSEVDEVMLRVADWLAKIDQSEYDVVVSCTTPGSSANFVVSPARNAYCIDLKGNYQWNESLAWNLDHTFLAEPSRLSLFAWGSEEMCVHTGSSKPMFSLSLKPSSSKETGEPANFFEFGLGHSKENLAWSLSIDPMPILRAGHESDTHRLAEGVLTLTSEHGVARIDERTGRILSFDSGPGAPSGFTIHVETVRRTFERRAEEVRMRSAPFAVETAEQDQMWRLLSFALKHFVPLQFLATDRDKQLVDQLQSAVDSPAFIAWLNERREAKQVLRADGKPEDGQQEFIIPESVELEAADGGWLDDVLQTTPALADESFVRGSWPWTVLRESALIGSPKSKGWFEELRRLEMQPDNGPLFHLSMAMAFDDNGNVGASIAQQGLQRLDEQLLCNDLAHFTEGDLWGAKAVEKLAELATHLSDEQRVLALSYAPPIARAPLEAVLNRRAERPKEPAREAVTEAVLQAWRGGWREQVQRELQAIAGPVAGEG